MVWILEYFGVFLGYFFAKVFFFGLLFFFCLFFFSRAALLGWVGFVFVLWFGFGLFGFGLFWFGLFGFGLYVVAVVVCWNMKPSGFSQMELN